jgi:hypothetical protein
MVLNMFSKQREGGWKKIRLKTWNRAATMKQIWHLLINHQSIWAL